MKLCRCFFWLLLVFTFGLLPQNEAAAQKFRGDALYLKNGSVVNGRIIRNDSLDGIRIANDCGIWLYALNEIDSIGPQTTGRYYKTKSKGYVNYSSAGLLFGYENYPIPSLMMVHGNKFSNDFSAGIGLGYEYFDWAVLPVFADLRYFFYEQGFSPFVIAQAGYAVTLERKPESFWGGTKKRSFGGPMLSAGAGIRAGISRQTAFTLSITYRFQKLSHETSSQWEPGTFRKVQTHYNRIAVSVGFLFE